MIWLYYLSQFRNLHHRPFGNKLRNTEDKMVLNIMFKENLTLRLNIKLDAHTDTLLPCCVAKRMG